MCCGDKFIKCFSFYSLVQTALTGEEDLDKIFICHYLLASRKPLFIVVNLLPVCHNFGKKIVRTIKKLRLIRIRNNSFIREWFKFFPGEFTNVFLQIYYQFFACFIMTIFYAEVGRIDSTCDEHSEFTKWL